MNRLIFVLGFLGVVATGYAPVVLYANEDGHTADVRTAAIQAAPVAPLASPTSSDETVAVWSPPQLPASPPRNDIAVKESAIPTKAEAIYADALPALYEGEYDAPIWAVVTRGAKLHADANVSSPTTWLYPVGAKLNVIGYRRGWFEVADPESARRGFIYANYYLEALSTPISAPLVAKVETPPAIPTPAPTRTALAEPAPAPVVKRTAGRQWQSSLSRLAPPPTPTNFVASARPSSAPNRDGVESLLEKAMRR